MRPLPDLTNVEAMAARGRFSALNAARNEAIQELRDLFVAAGRMDMHELPAAAEQLRAIADRFDALAGMDV